MSQNVHQDDSGRAASGGVNARTAVSATDGRAAAAAAPAGWESVVRKASRDKRCHTNAGSTSDGAFYKNISLSPDLQFVSSGAACEAGRFGVGCVERCHCVNAASCHHVTGECLCLPGWRGKRCDKGTKVKNITHK